jgi:hypothetical protein
MTDEVIDFKSASPPHDFARKERKLQDVRKRLNAGLDQPAKKKKKRRKKKR